MHTPIETTVHRWLKLMGIHINKKYLTERLASHPDHPSALSITSLLDELGMDNAVAQVHESQLDDLPTPFLAHVDGLGFAIVEDARQAETTIPDFRRRWTGIVIFGDRPDKVRKPADLVKAETDARRSKIIGTMAGCVVATLSVASFFLLGTGLFWLLLPALSGLIISGSIILSELGIDTAMSRKLCGAGDETCKEVIHSKGSNLPFGLKLSDLGISFFAGMALCLLVGGLADAAFQQHVSMLVTLVSFGSIPFTLASIYYQGKVLKKWCRSCLLVVTACWAMVWLSAIQYQEVVALDVFRTIALAGIFMTPAAAWFTIRPLLNRMSELTGKTIRLLRIARSPELFASYLFSRRKVNTRPMDGDFQLGNPDAPLQLTVVSSPSCGPCVETHALLHTLLEKYRSRLGITVRFLINDEDEAHQNTRAVEHMLRYAHSHPAFLSSPEKVDQLLSDWYDTMDLTTFQSMHPVDEDISVKAIVGAQAEWCRSAGIQYTPVLFVNGYQLESPFEPDDLPEHMESLLEIFAETPPEPESAEAFNSFAHAQNY